jgi:prephenate dehydrogenase
MIIGIAGIGLIGGSLAKAYKEHAGIRVYGYDIDNSTTAFAQIYGAIDGALDENTIEECDCIFIALYPKDAIAYLKEIAPKIKPDALVIDCCGIKREICEVGFTLAQKYGFIFAGGHPMAGIHQVGFASSRASLFKGECMVIVPPVFDDMALFNRIKCVIELAGFKKISITSAEAHDKIIAYTSQMAHVVSNAYIKSPTALEHKGFSAGSYKDLTRVAWLNPNMWAELFIENNDNLVCELDLFINEIKAYRDAIADKDYETLRRLLEAGKKCKEEVDG